MFKIGGRLFPAPEKALNDVSWEAQKEGRRELKKAYGFVEVLVRVGDSTFYDTFPAFPDADNISNSHQHQGKRAAGKVYPANSGIEVSGLIRKVERPRDYRNAHEVALIRYGAEALSLYVDGLEDIVEFVPEQRQPLDSSMTSEIATA